MRSIFPWAGIGNRQIGDEKRREERRKHKKEEETRPSLLSQPHLLLANACGRVGSGGGRNKEENKEDVDVADMWHPHQWNLDTQVPRHLKSLWFLSSKVLCVFLRA